MRILGFSLKRLSLGRTRYGWLGCVVCQRKVDEAIIAFLKKRFGKNNTEGMPK